MLLQAEAAEGGALTRPPDLRRYPVPSEAHSSLTEDVPDLRQGLAVGGTNNAAIDARPVGRTDFSDHDPGDVGDRQ